MLIQILKELITVVTLTSILGYILGIILKNVLEYGLKKDQ
jgi:hypothetical protein